MAQKDEFAFLDATAQAELVRKKEVKPIELVEAATLRIERLNPELNAVVTPMYDLAREAAEGELPDGPFTGVPFLLKDLLAQYRGVRLTAGSKALENFVPPRDSELVVRLKRAGLIVVGKTNTPEFGALPTTEPLLFGPTKNPWDTTRTPGGSSGGSCASVAAGIVPMAHANDGGGSIRIPSSCCGLFGLKPTRARNPLGPNLGDAMGGLVCEHAVTRSVRDSAALLDATSGPDVGDPYWAPPPVRPFIDEVGADPGRLKIALTVTRRSGGAVEPDCERAVRDAAELCASLGHQVEEAMPSIGLAERLPQVFTGVWLSGLASTIDGIALISGQAAEPDNYEPLTWVMYQIGRQLSASDYLLAVQAAQMVTRDIARFMEKYDLWLTPTLAEPPVTLGQFGSTDAEPLEGWRRSGQFAPFTAVCNLTGQPAMNVPLWWSDEGLPIGVHFIGRFGDEATLFRLAAQLEQARPWAERRPPVSA